MQALRRRISCNCTHVRTVYTILLAFFLFIVLANLVCLCFLHVPDLYILMYFILLYTEDVEDKFSYLIENCLSLQTMSEVIMRYTNYNLTGQVDFNEALKLVFEHFNSTSACEHIVAVFTDEMSNKGHLSDALELLDSDSMVCLVYWVLSTKYPCICVSLYAYSIAPKNLIFLQQFLTTNNFVLAGTCFHFHCGPVD